MKISIISNCQHQSISLACKAIVSNCKVYSINMGQISGLDEGALKSLQDEINESNLVLYHPHSIKILEESKIDISKSEKLAIPGFVFSGLQPDICYVHWSEARRGIVTSAIGDYHSAICLASYIDGRSADETLMLYNKLVYSRLGYISAYDQSKDHIINHYKSYGWEISHLFDKWECRNVPFMYSINHPRLYVISDVINEIFKQKGLSSRYIDADFYYNDPLMDQPIWPVYQEIADEMCFDGGYIFKAAAFRDKLYNLDQFVRGSFESYDNVPKNVIGDLAVVQRTLNVIREFKT